MAIAPRTVIGYMEKKRLREIDSRVRFLTKRLDELTIVRDIPKDQSRAFFGAWVTLIAADDMRVTYQLVGPDEFNISIGKVSIDSPIAKALLKKQMDDEVTLQTPTGEKILYIERIEYRK